MKFQRNTDSQLVYSTDKTEKLCPKCGESDNLCDCKTNKIHSTDDSIVRVRREIKGRKGKTVTTISGISRSNQEMNDLASDLKRFCGTGGSVKEGVIVIQGDHRKKIVPWLENKGYKVKLAGG